MHGLAASRASWSRSRPRLWDSAVKDPLDASLCAVPSLRGLRGLELAAIRRGYELAALRTPTRSERESTGMIRSARGPGERRGGRAVPVHPIHGQVDDEPFD